MLSANLSNWLQAIAAAIAILGTVGWGFRWTIKHYLSELRPNHGSSLNDKINLVIIPMLEKLSQSQDHIEERVIKLEGRFEQHVDEIR